jgi:hypothetical protein
MRAFSSVMAGVCASANTGHSTHIKIPFFNFMGLFYGNNHAANAFSSPLTKLPQYLPSI